LVFASGNWLRRRREVLQIRRRERKKKKIIPGLEKAELEARSKCFELSDDIAKLYRILDEALGRIK